MPSTFKRKLSEVYTNYLYHIVNYFPNEKHLFQIKSIYENKDMFISMKQLKYMSFPHCFTCHSTQGLIIQKPYTIFDINIAYTDRRWIYTAITRATYLENITICKHAKKECEMLERCKYKQYFKLMIETISAKTSRLEG